MPGKILMKALVATVVNLEDGSILVLDPDHKTDARARYPRVNTEKDRDRLVREGFAEVHTGRAPHFKGFRNQVEPGPTARQQAKDAAPGQKVEMRRGPRQETDEEAAAAADAIDGLADDTDAGGGDPTGAPAA